MRQFFIYLSAVLFVVFTVSCAEESAPADGQDEEVIEVGTEEAVIEDQVHHQIPSPHEMMEFISAANADFKPELLCTTDIYEKYVDLKGKSMGMGIYIADLAYASSFSRFQESMEYYKVIVKMADDIGISSVFDEAMLSRIQNNLKSPDSLEAITDNSYYSIIGELEQNDRGKVVAMIAAGGFLESLFIATQLVDKFDANDPVVKRIADQKLIYENLMAYLEEYKDDQNVEWTINDMMALKQIFEEVSDNRRDTKFSEKNGKKVLGGKGGVYIVEQEFEDLRDRTAQLRNTVTFNPPLPQ